MTFWKTWFDLKSRFLLTLGIFSLLVVPLVFVSASGTRSELDEWGLDAAEVAEAGSDFEFPDGVDGNRARAFFAVSNGWFEGDSAEIFGILAIILAVGGVAAEGRNHSELLTFSLPVRRSAWLGAHWLMAVLLTMALTLVVPALLLMAGFLYELPVRLSSVIPAGLAGTAVAAVWIGPAMLTSFLSGDTVRGALTAIAIIIVLAMLKDWRPDESVPGLLASINDWNPLLLGHGERWEGGPPVRLIGVALVIGAGPVLATLRLFTRIDI